MPRTRADVDREEKVAEILDAAERQVLSGGYRTLSIAALARELGLAQNAIYWYFASKDELFVAVLKRLLGRIAIPERMPADPEARVLRVVDRLGELQGLRASVRERARESPVVARFESEFRALVRELLHRAFRERLPAAELTIAVDAFMAAAEGAVGQGLTPRRRRRVLRHVLERLFSDAGESGGG